MSKVKTYAVNCNDAWLNTDGDDVSGSYVKYADYKALATRLDIAERACAAMAAENAGLKTAHPQPFGPEMMKALDAYEKHQDEVPETGMLDAFFILRDSIRVTTSVTDAWVNEQRAIGVDMVVKYHMERAEALKEVNRKGYSYHSSAALDALDVAAQLRQKAISEQD